MAAGESDDLVVVWGNCQAPPLAELLREPLATHGLHVVDVPPVYLATADDVRRVHDVLRRCAVLVTQPIRDEYPQPGCGTEQLVALMPSRARIVRLPVVYDVSAFPFQVRGYRADGRRVDAPVTDYHDLRIVYAAARGRSPAEAMDQWPVVSDDALRAVGRASLEELRRREVGQDVVASDIVAGAGALWTMTHPGNELLRTMADRVLGTLGLDGAALAPPRQFLGQRRAAVDAQTAHVLGWPPASARPDWLVDGRVVPTPEVVSEHLAFYADRADVVAETLSRNAVRSKLLGFDVAGPDVE